MTSTHSLPFAVRNKHENVLRCNRQRVLGATIWKTEINVLYMFLDILRGGSGVRNDFFLSHSSNVQACKNMCLKRFFEICKIYDVIGI